MSTVNNTSDAGFNVGSSLQLPLLPANTFLGLGTSVPGTSSVVSALVYTGGYKTFAFGTTSSQAGSVSIQRFIDAAGLIPQGAALTVSLSSATAAVLNSVDGFPFQSLQVTVNNSAGSAATLTHTMLLLQAN